MDVAFVSSVDFNHYPGGLSQQVLDHRFDDAAILSDYWAHKYLLDLDGMSYSGKFFAFLGSDSVVIKSSVYQEFFSDWIQPWSVPFSMCFLSSSFDNGCRFQASLHPTINILCRNIQHPCFFFWWYTRGACSCELHRATSPAKTAHTPRWG